MRKTLLVVGIIALVAAGALLQASQEEIELADFEITVTVTPNGIELKSDHGCAWTEASYSGSGETYSFAIDEYGVSGGE